MNEHANSLQLTKVNDNWSSNDMGIGTGVATERPAPPPPVFELTFIPAVQSEIQIWTIIACIQSVDTSGGGPTEV